MTQYTLDEPSGKQCRPHRWIWSNRQLLICVLGPLILLPVLLFYTSLAGKCAYVILLMGFYWMTEAIPMAATALIPMILFPAFGVETSQILAPKYVNNATMVIMGGMLVAIAVEKWNLHKRCALRVLMLVGSKPKWLMLGFIMVTCFLSMWLSNTATTAMLIPILEAVLNELERHRNMPDDTDPDTIEEDTEAADGRTAARLNRLRELLNDQATTDTSAHSSYGTITSVATEQTPEEKSNRTDEAFCISEPKPQANEIDFSRMSQGLSLCIIYGANLGGISTLTGTAPNLLLKGFVDDYYSQDNPITYGSWIIFATPISWIAVVIAWAWLVCYFLGWRELCFWRKDQGPTDNTAARVIRNEYEKLGSITYAEVVVLIHFIGLVVLWMARDPGFGTGWDVFFPEGYVSDGSVALLCSVLLFMLPSKRPRLSDFTDCSGTNTKTSERLLDWNSVQHRFPWGVLLLFGGGFAMAQGCETSGLSEDIGKVLSHLDGIPVWLLSLTFAFVTMVTTEILNNTATIAIILPVVSKMADVKRLNPLRLMIPCTIACSFAFMLPVATLPAAIVYAYGRCKVPDMVKAGIIMNLLCIPVLQLAIYGWATPFFDLNTYPTWAMGNINDTLLSDSITDV